MLERVENKRKGFRIKRRRGQRCARETPPRVLTRPRQWGFWGLTKKNVEFIRTGSVSGRA